MLGRLNLDEYFYDEEKHTLNINSHLEIQILKINE
jgi:hypothetical protein